MAKPRKNYAKKNFTWHLILFYLLIGAIACSLLFYSGTLNFGDNKSPQVREIQYYQ